MPTATLNGTVIAEAPESDIIRLEGNIYFPPSAVKSEFLATSPTPYTCPWKGACQYFTVDVDGQQLPDRAWSYPTLHASAIDRVGTEMAPPADGKGHSARIVRVSGVSRRGRRSPGRPGAPRSTRG